MYCKKVRNFSSLAFKLKNNNKTLPIAPQLLTKTEIAFIKKMVLSEMEELESAQTIGEQADALVDAIYYLQDAAAKKGINLDPIFEIVHEANMSKVKNKQQAKLGTDGKVLKPKNWKDPGVLIEKEIYKQQQTSAF